MIHPFLFCQAALPQESFSSFLRYEIPQDYFSSFLSQIWKNTNWEIKITESENWDIITGGRRGVGSNLDWGWWCWTTSFSTPRASPGPGTPATLLPPPTSILLCSSIPTTKTMLPLLAHGGIPPFLPSLSSCSIFPADQIECRHRPLTAGHRRRCQRNSPPHPHTSDPLDLRWWGMDWVKGTRS